MNRFQSRKMTQMSQSEIRNMSLECARVGGINLSQGICDLKLPDILAGSAYQAILDDHNHYTRFDGIDLLREQIAQKSMKFNHLQVDAKKNIIVSAGATGAFYSACFALLNPGDEMILFEPYYGYHEATLIALDIVPVYATLTPPEWDIHFDQLESLITEKTKAILINTPSNPCGKVFSADELEKIADFAIEKDLLIFTDEIYEYITYDGKQHVSLGSLKKAAERTVTVSGYSKTFSITGWRIGYTIADEAMTALIGSANDLIYVCAPAPLQHAVAAAISNLTDDFYAEMRIGYQQKRDLFCGMLSDVGLTPYVPQGAYYVLADMSKVPGENSKDKAMWFLKETGIASVPGEAFYKDTVGKTLARFCFAKDIHMIEKACDLIKSNSKKWL
ncbi:MAG: pyridoxal phosphate-dependent aminotransferase [Flexilinea flocculi]|nr:pyridoxal phosphate-dependent aminotransferase [Flexilinea flocculi]